MSEGGMVDFFEGREKTVRVYFTVPECCSLLDLETDVWEKLLKQTGCSIIGELRHKEVTAFILSESSLFVWRDHILLKTCGTTTPLLLLPLLNRQLGWLEDYEWFSYSNGALLKPDLQPSGYRSNEELEQQITHTLLDLTSSTDGSRSSLSFSDGSFEFVSQKSTKHNSPTHTVVEIKLINLQECGQFYLTSDATAIDKMFSDLFREPWETDHFHFEPCGFSLNALHPEKRESYATIHVTPELGFSYVSFETNHLNELRSQVKKLCSLFCPRQVIVTAQYPVLPLCLREKGDKFSGSGDVIMDLLPGIECERQYFEEYFEEDLKIVSYKLNLPRVQW